MSPLVPALKNNGVLTLAKVGLVPDPENEGWYILPAGETGRFNDIYGKQRCRIESDGKVRIRVHPEFKHTNSHNTVHGGFILALIDHVIFISPVALGIPRVLGGVTIELSTKFFGALRPDEPMDVVFQVMRETGGMIFSRGVIEQYGSEAVAFSGITKRSKELNSES
jgi:acyl-coenzyme A thioesterase PaaI-like protein